jgi:hypothetical protein
MRQVTAAAAVSHALRSEGRPPAEDAPLPPLTKPWPSMRTDRRFATEPQEAVATPVRSRTARRSAAAAR